MSRVGLAALIVLMLVACERGERFQQDLVPRAAPAEAVRIEVVPDQVERTMTRQLLGQAVWYSWHAYTWDFEEQRTIPPAMELFQDFGMGTVGHYPGVGVITHDFQWKHVIGPLEERVDPTPREHSFDTPRFLEFGPDEYGQFLNEYRAVTGMDVAGSIQVNIVNASAEEAADWVEYMNAPNDGSNPGGGVDWAAVRAGHGHPEPYDIRYWELGNEPHFTAAEIGHLTAEEYVARIREFVPLMKERDPDIKVMAYVNPFDVTDRTRVGVAVEDLDTESGLTWSQTVIRDAGEDLDYLYFHWYGGWNDRVHDYEHFATSMYTGLVPWLDRLAQDVQNYAPSAEARERLSRIFIPEWNVYGGWVRPLARGTALQGALAYSRTLHVFASRAEIQSAQHLALAAPYPDPFMRLGLIFDIREGYITVKCQEDGSDCMGTALAPLAQLWSRAFLPEVVTASIVSDVPQFDNGVPVLDVTVMRSSEGDRLHTVITNTGSDSLQVRLDLGDFVAQPDAQRLTVTGDDLADNNSWDGPEHIVLEVGSVELSEGSLILTIPPYAIEAILMVRAS